jgi:glycosyltransferase involved in cell wall biosynthesis
VGGGTRADRGLKGWLLERLGLAQNIKEGLGELIARYDLTGTFHLLGATSDVQRVYERIDVLCFPSHFDAPGRPVFEAAFSGVPAIVAVSQPRDDTLSDGETGLAVPGQDPARLAEAIAYFADNRAEVERMGAAARQLAVGNFNPLTNAAKLLALYQRVAFRASL